jgi:hypothetical protein
MLDGEEKVYALKCVIARVRPWVIGRFCPYYDTSAPFYFGPKRFGPKIIKEVLYTRDI